MKHLLLALAFLTTASHAVEVKRAAYDAKADTIEIDVVYSGGCEEHEFTLDLGPCMETYPMQLRAKLVDHNTTDFCDAIIGRTISLPASSVEGCRPAHVTIRGDRGEATVYVP